MWNTTTLTPPPINSFNGKSVTIDLKAVSCILNNGMKSLNEKIYKALYTESLLLSRCVYRMKLQFRSDKGFKCMEKTNTLIKKFLKFDLKTDLMEFYKSVPKVYEKDLYLPTKQMLEYLLVRVQGYTQLLKRIGETAVNTAELMNYRLGLGHLWVTAAVVLSLISRVWQICKYLIKKCCVVYNDLLPLRDKLELKGVKWLEDGYEFPSNLTDWLDVDWLQEKYEIISNFQIDLPLFNLLDESDDEDVQYCYQYKLNDCVIVDDDSILGDDDVTWVETYNKQQTNITNNNDLDFIIDDSDTSSVELNINDAKINQKTNLEVMDVESPINLDNTEDVIDISSVIEDNDDDDDDDIGESISREQVSIPVAGSGTSKKKKKKKKKGRVKNRNLIPVFPIKPFKKFNGPHPNKKEGIKLEPSSVKIKKEIKEEFKPSVKSLIKKEFKS